MNPKQKTQKELEEEFFGEPNPLGEESPAESTAVPETRHEVRTSSREVLEGAHDPERIIDRLQASEQLPESVHTPHLIALLKFFGEKLGLAVDIDGKFTLFPGNAHVLRLSTANLRTFLSRGAAASVFLIPLLSSKEALAQSIQPGMEVIGPSYEMFHWESLLALLLLLGISAAAAYKIIQRFRKSEKEKDAKKKFKNYEDAKKTGDPEKTAKAKEAVYTATMGELPTDMDEALNTTDIVSSDELEKALKYKKQADAAIQKAIHEIEAAMHLPEEKSLANLKKKKDEALKEFEKHIAELEKLYAKLAAEWVKTQSPYLKKQIEFEKKKLKYIMDYLGQMKFKWIILIQNSINEVIAGTPPEELEVEDEVLKAIHDLEKKLNDVLDQQGTLAPPNFSTAVQEVEEGLDHEKQTADSLGIPGYGKKKTEVVGFDHIILLHNGEYDHHTGIAYIINGTERHVDLPEGITVQIWINEDKKIKMNFNIKGTLAASHDLVVGADGFRIKETGQTLQAFVEEKSAAAGEAPEASAELGPEAAPILAAVADRALAVKSRIQNKTYQVFGEKVTADDEAINYHLIRMHREFYKGKPHMVIRFTLSESYWKKALANLHKQKDISKHTVSFSFENESGGQKHIGQQMLRFNVVVGGKTVPVFIPADSHYRALMGEVRILFDAATDYSAEEVQKVFAEAVTRIGISPHIKPETEEAREKLQEQLKKIRRESHDPANHQRAVHSEYQAEEVVPESVAALRQKGLHSVYHQFPLSALEHIFRTGKIMSTATRWSKGILADGMSSATDMSNGGATEVFTRIHTAQSLGTWYSSDKPALVFSPALLGRMDCYCYSSDQFGSKLPGVFDQRISPEKLVSMMSSSYSSGHEVMFHDAINVQEAAYIVYHTPSAVIAKLKAFGITTLGGKPLEQAVITPQQFKSVKF